jgi:hypothetical protein
LSAALNADLVGRYAFTKTSRGNHINDNYEIDKYLLNGVEIYIYIYAVSKSYTPVCPYSGYWIAVLFLNRSRANFVDILGKPLSF